MQVARPRIVRETRRPIEEKEPPERAALSPHDWLSGDSVALYAEVAESGKIFDVYLSTTAEKKIRLQAEKDAPRRLEVMGFLLGEVRVWKGHKYVVVRDIVTTELKSSSSKVRFDPEGFPKLFSGLDDSGFDYVLVGWYHSHPGHTCFLSRIDLETQRRMFDQPYHTAIVIDPVNQDMKAFRLSGDGYDEVAIAIFEGEANGRPKKPRSRRLKIKSIGQ
jgi:proteasome lid subunit RPN8/RPN11